MSNLSTRLLYQVAYYSGDIPGSVIADLQEAASELVRLQEELDKAWSYSRILERQQHTLGLALGMLP